MDFKNNGIPRDFYRPFPAGANVGTRHCPKQACKFFAKQALPKFGKGKVVYFPSVPCVSYHSQNSPPATTFHPQGSGIAPTEPCVWLKTLYINLTL